MPKTILKRPYYTLALTEGKDAELTMYGEIVESQPIDWWTGEPIKGQFIILQDFINDLETLKDAETLTIHLNSLGGDAFSATTIHNRLRELSAKKTCIVDGVAMSGGSLIMCACDTVKVNPSSIIMIHDCWTFIFDMLNAPNCQKLADQLSVIDNSQAEIYARKTGKSLEEIRGLMDEETYMSGREAVELGFADELLEDEADPNIAVSTDKRTLFSCGRSMRIAALGKLPEGIKTIETVPISGDDNNTPETSGKNGGNPMTLEELRQSDPEAAAALLAEAQASVSHEEAIQAERQRIADIDAIASLFDADTVNAAKYTQPCTAQEMCYRAAQESAKNGKAFMANLMADNEDSGADEVTPAPAPEDEDKPITNADIMAMGEAAARKALGQTKEV